VAEGDSWFDYPFSDVLDELEDRHGWDVVSVASAGDRLEDMAYDYHQLEKLERALRKLKDQGKEPKAVLVSGGGNDIAGDEFAMLLNHKRSGLPPLNAQIVAGLFEDRLAAAFVSVAFAVTTLCQELFGKAIPILLHGYDRPVPDGRGVLGGLWILPGPWLEPGFLRKGFDDLEETTDLMAQLIEAFNDQVSAVPGGPGLSHVQYVDLRGILSNELKNKKYKKSWANELHPTDDGFEAVADRIHEVLTTLP
jgi:lysophospholipase L1-like esterase